MFSQTFIEEQYAFPLEKEPAVIVDAGANIGTACCYFAMRFPSARILALEPDPSNYGLLSQNVAHLPRVIPIQAALWSRRGALELVTANRHKSQVEVRESPPERLDGAVPCLAMADVLADYQLPFVDLLKIDVEGAEKSIFENPSDWIDRVSVIVIELHEALAPGSTRLFNRATAAFSCRTVCGENLVVSRDDGMRFPRDSR